MFDDICRFGRLSPGDRVIEVGAGTGIATEGLADRGLVVTALEPAPAMAALAQHKLQGHGEVVLSRFEDWNPTMTDVRLVVSCNAWHWIEPAAGLRQLMRVLAPGGALALAWTVIVSWGEDVFEKRMAEELGAVWPKSHDLVTTSLEAFEDGGRFEPFEVRRHRFSRTMDADSYVAVTHTYGSSRDRERDLIVRRIIDDDCGGSITKVEDAVVYLTRRQSPAPIGA